MLGGIKCYEEKVMGRTMVICEFFILKEVVKKDLGKMTFEPSTEGGEVKE